jgi:RNA polymerase sigma-70 factor (ECF subfamily)
VQVPTPVPHDPEALADFERRFERTYADVHRYCARRCASPEDAEEATTDVFAIAWRRRAEVPAEPEDRLWLFGVARHVVRNQVRSAQRRERLVARLREIAAAGPAVTEPVGPGTVARALHALPESDRELLLLAAWEGLAPAEIARVLGVPAPVVSRRLHRARRRFAHVLAAAHRHATAPAEEPSWTH